MAAADRHASASFARAAAQSEKVCRESALWAAAFQQLSRRALSCRTCGALRSNCLKRWAAAFQLPRRATPCGGAFGAYLERSRANPAPARRARAAQSVRGVVGLARGLQALHALPPRRRGHRQQQRRHPGVRFQPWCRLRRQWRRWVPGRGGDGGPDSAACVSRSAGMLLGARGRCDALAGVHALDAWCSNERRLVGL